MPVAGGKGEAPASDTRPYGSHADQWIEWSAPDAPSRGTVVLIHGGYWRAPFTAELMHPLVPAFTARGWTVANVEYRRGAAGWPAMRDDLASALAAVRAASPDARLAIVGHSVGGQLALLGGAEDDAVGDAVVALTPVTDLVRAYREGSGDGAAAEFFGGGPDELPEVYASASPLAQLPSRAEVLVVHGHDDERVPFAHGRDYVAAARAAGAAAGAADSAVILLELPHLAHRAAIDPDAPHWPAVHAWLDRWRGSGERPGG